MPEETRDLIAYASHDLWHGPGVCDGEYPGFNEATETLRAWWQDNCADVWVNQAAGEFSVEDPSYSPDDYVPGEWVEVASGFVKGIVFGDLAAHI